MMYPAMPTGRNGGGIRNAIVDNPSAGAAFRIRTALIIDIAELVLAHSIAMAPGMEPGAYGVSIPPGEKLKKKVLHGTIIGWLFSSPLMARCVTAYGALGLACPVHATQSSHFHLESKVALHKAKPFVKAMGIFAARI